MSSVYGINEATSSVTSTANHNLAQELDRDAFLKLLMTQMQHQDPLKPVQNTEFIAQLAQFSSLEQMQQVNSGMHNMAAVGYVGRTVTAMNPETGDAIIGKVTAVVWEGSTPKLQVDGRTVDISWVSRVE